MTIRARLLLGFGLVCLALVAVPLSMYMVESSKAIQSARLKQGGIAPSKALLVLVQLLQQHRGLSTSVLGGNRTMESQRAAKQIETDKAVEAFDAIVRADIRDPALAAAWRQTVETWRTLANGVASRTIAWQDSFAAHTALIGNHLKLLDLTMDYFGLSYDPTGQDYHLIIALLVHMPSLTEFLGQARARGTLLLGQRRVTLGDRLELMSLIGGVERQHEYLERELGKAIALNFQMTIDLGDIALASRVLAQQAMDLARTQVVAAERPRYSPVDYWTAFTRAIDGQFTLIDQGMVYLERGLQARMTTLRDAQIMTIGFIALVIVFAMWLGAVIIRAIKQDIAALQQSEEAQRHHAGELEVTVERLKQARAQLEARQRVTDSILRVPDLTTRLNIALQEILAPLGSTIKGAFYLVEDDRLVLKVQEGFSPTFLALGRDVPLEACPWVGAPIEQCSPWEGTDPITEALRQEGMMAWTGLPLMVEEKLEGILLLADSRVKLMDEDTLCTVRAMIDQVAVALYHARLYTESRERLARLITLREIDQAIAAQLPLEEVVNIVLNRAHSHVKTDAIGLSLIDWEKKRTTLAHLRLSGGVDIRDEAFALSESVLEDLGVRMQPVIIYDLLGDPRVMNHRRIIYQYGLKSYLGLPLIVQGQAIGILHVCTVTPHRFTADEVDFFVTLAGQTAISIQNIRLFEAQSLTASQLAEKVEELERAQSSLIEAERLRAMGQMAAGVAHDFNNALMGVLGQTQLMRLSLERGPVAAALRGMEGHVGLLECLARQEQGILDAAETIRKIREATRQRNKEAFGPVALGEVAEQVLAISRPRWKDQAEAAGTPITVQTAFAETPPVLGHAAELREAITNLLFNALDAMPHGGTVTIATNTVPSPTPHTPHTNEFVELSVTDTGVGMSQEVQARLFEPFFTTKGARGTGLGLSMVHGIVSRHLGEITVQSAEGQGTTITLRLPVAGVPDEVVPLPAAPLPPSVPLTLLVIDDDPLLAETLSDLLRSLGHEAVIATSGKAGLTRLAAKRFDLVMTDLGMPEMSGWEVAQAVKACWPWIPVILVTGWGDTIERDRLEGTGVNAVLAKPYTVSQLQYALAAGYRDHPAGRGEQPSG